MTPIYSQFQCQQLSYRGGVTHLRPGPAPRAEPVVSAAHAVSATEQVPLYEPLLTGAFWSRPETGRRPAQCPHLFRQPHQPRQAQTRFGTGTLGTPQAENLDVLKLRTIIGHYIFRNCNRG